MAPDGSLLAVEDLSAEITLPAGADRVPGSFEQPGDDPLALPRFSVADEDEAGLAAIVRAERLTETVRGLHRRFFEEGGPR